MAGAQRTGGLILSALVLLAPLVTGCALTSRAAGEPAPAEEVRRLRIRVAELEREARVREVELRRLRAALSGTEGRPSASAAPRSTEQPTPEPVPTVEETPVELPRSAPIEEDDLVPEPIAGTPDTEGPDAEGPAASGAPAGPAAGGTAPDREAQAAYDEAYSLYHQGRYEDAEALFSAYLESYPATRLADNAQFWIGECRYARGEIEAALEAFRRTVERFPDGNKVADAMVKAGKCLEALGDVEGARATYREVRRAHPGTAAAAIAEERLLMLN